MAGAEIVGTKERVVDVAAPGPTCPANTGEYASRHVCVLFEGLDCECQRYCCRLCWGLLN